MKIALRVLAGVVVLAVIAVIGALVALTTIDPNQYRDRLTAEVKEATGRELVIKGNLAVDISLIPTIVADDVTFANAPWGSRPDMASLKRLEARLEILPLLSGEARIDRIVLVEPDILLEVAPDGRANWDFGTKSDEAAAVPIVSSLSIDKGKFRYVDRQTKQDLVLALDRVRIVETAGRRLAIDMTGAYNAAPFQLKGTVDPLRRLAADASDFALELEASAFAASARFTGTVGKLLSGPQLGLDVALSGTDLTATLLAVKAVVPELDVSAVPPLGGFELSGRATGAATQPSIEKLRFAISTTDLLKIEGAGRASADTYTFDSVTAQIRGSDIAGTLTIKTGGKLPDVTAELKAKHFDLGDLTALSSNADDKPAEPAKGPAVKGASPRAGDGRVFPADPLPLDGLKAVNANVALKAERLVVEGMAIDAVDAAIVLKDGRLTVDPVAATIAGGRLGGRAVLDVAGRMPALDTNLTIERMNLGQFLKERGVTDQLTGRASAKLIARGTGASVRAIMASLTGTSEVVVDQGRIKARYVEMLAADLLKQLNPLSDETDTKLNCFVSRFDIKQGIATSTGLLFDTERMTVAGGGTVDLRQERLDLTIEPEPKDASLVSLAVPLHVSGTFISPSVAPTTASMVKGVAGLAIMGLTPLGVLATLAKLGTSDQNPCVAALDHKPAPAGGQQRPTQQGQPQPPSANPVENITRGVQDTFRSIFGGGK